MRPNGKANQTALLHPEMCPLARAAWARSGWRGDQGDGQLFQVTAGCSVWVVWGRMLVETKGISAGAESGLSPTYGDSGFLG